MEISFVILHYLVYEMTKECVDTLLKVFAGKEFHIVIVDNGSPNETGVKLKEHYADNSHITVLINKENLGFARGNNVGYSYIRERLRPRYTVVMNNDVLIKDPLFIEKIRSLEDKYGFDVLGPDIYNPNDDVHQNPLRLKPITMEEVKRRLNISSFVLKLPHVCYARSAIKRFIYRTPQYKRSIEEYGKPRCDVVLHGACLIFSSRFLEERKECFNPQTFIYGEEHILYQECKKLNLKMVYSPEINVEHYMRVSTDASVKSNYQRYVNKYKFLKESAIVLLKVLEYDKHLGLEEIQEQSVKILYALDNICRQEGIKYFLAYGTLLGAIRHDGFIPWDDDIDVMMPRRDYDRFEEYCINNSEELYPLALFSQKTESKYPYVINRFCDTRYSIRRDDEEDCGMGLFVDIYPLDGMGDDIDEAIALEGRVHPLSSMFCQASKKYIKIGRTKRVWRRAARYLRFVYAKRKGKQFFGKKIAAISNQYSYDDSDYVGCVVWRTYGERDIYKKEWIDELIEHKFEEKMLMIPKNYDSLLSQIYGDYMTMPPVEKRVPHHYYKAYKR